MAELLQDQTPGDLDSLDLLRASRAVKLRDASGDDSILTALSDELGVPADELEARAGEYMARGLTARRASGIT